MTPTPMTPTPMTPPGYLDTKPAHLKRLRRVEGQIRGLQRMVEEETYCIDVLTQISAATRALEAVGLALLDEHLTHCVTQKRPLPRRRMCRPDRLSARNDDLDVERVLFVVRPSPM